jgi:hypothetical protein
MLMIQAEIKHCKKCNGFGWVLCGTSKRRMICEACGGTGRGRAVAPFSIWWMLGEEDDPKVAIESFGSKPDRESAIALALKYARELGPAYRGGRMLVNDNDGDEVFTTLMNVKELSKR